MPESQSILMSTGYGLVAKIVLGGSLGLVMGEDPRSII